MDIAKVPPLKFVPDSFEEWQKQQKKEEDEQVVLIRDAAEKLTKKNIDYFPTGFSDFDEVIDGGVTEGDLNIIAGRSGEGKTSFGQTLTYHLNNLAVPTLWFSYEVSLRHLWGKFQSMGMDNDRLVSYIPMKMASGRVSWVEEKIKEGVLKYQTKVIFVDHLGFLLPRLDRGEKMRDLSMNYSAYLGTICRQLKTLAVATESIIFLLVHVRKSNGELGLDDLANSAAIGQEADLVWAVERQKNKDIFDGQVYSNETKIKILKNRRTGQTPVITCTMKNNLFVKHASQNN